MPRKRPLCISCGGRIHYKTINAQMCGDCVGLVDTYEGVDANRIARVYEIGPEVHGRLYVMQKGRCAICHVESKALVIDHNHETGEVRGLLCNTCNLGIGQFHDNAAVLARAAAYVLDPPALTPQAKAEIRADYRYKLPKAE